VAGDVGVLRLVPTRSFGDEHHPSLTSTRGANPLLWATTRRLVQARQPGARRSVRRRPPDTARALQSPNCHENAPPLLDPVRTYPPTGGGKAHVPGARTTGPAAREPRPENFEPGSENVAWRCEVRAV
jgi:hypothetical protein